MASRTASLLLLSVLFLQTGCFLENCRSSAEHAAVDKKDVPGFEFSAELRELKIEEAEPPRKRLQALRVSFLSDQQTHPKNDRVRGTVFIPKSGEGPFPAVLVFSILQSGEFFSLGLGRALAKSGMVAFVVDQKGEIFRTDELDLEFSDAVLRQAIVDSRKIVTWLQGRPEVDRSRVGAVGISMGGIQAALLAGIDPRITASVWMLAGGDLVSMLAYTMEPGIRRARKKILPKQGLTPEQFARQYRDALIRPEDYARHVDPAGVLMVNACFDRVVPKQNRRLLWEAAGRPQRRFVPLGHFSSLLVYPMSKRWAVRFFKEQFGTGKVKYCGDGTPNRSVAPVLRPVPMVFSAPH